MGGFGHVFSQLFQTWLIQSSDASSFRAFSTAHLSFFFRSSASLKQCCGGAVRSCQQLSHSSTNPGFRGLNVNVLPQQRHFSSDSMRFPCGWVSEECYWAYRTTRRERGRKGKGLLQFHSVVLPTERISSIIGFVFWPSTSPFQ